MAELHKDMIEELTNRKVLGIVLEHHLAHGDFSRWILGTIQDRDLAAAVGAIERNLVARHAAGSCTRASTCSMSSTRATSPPPEDQQLVGPAAAAHASP